MSKWMVRAMIPAFSDATLKGIIDDLGEWLNTTKEGEATNSEYCGDIFDVWVSFIDEYTRRKKEELNGA